MNTTFMNNKLNDSKLSSSTTSSVRGPRKTIEDYEFLINEKSKFKTSELGQGSYGTVKKAKDKATGKVVAIKIMNKKGIFQYSSKENLKREISIQKALRHPHVVRLYTYFEDSDNVYLVLEFAENGTLFQYLRHRKNFSEKEAFIYFFQTCLGIDYLHKKNIIHRDLKPENLLLDIQGNVKLCDFGWSAEAESKRHTFCGTIDYMAPEMIKNHPHDHRLDIWCLGVLLYEMLHGYAPFKGRSDQEKTANISRNVPITFDPSLSSDAVDLIKRILQPVPVNRASMLEIFQHPWMQQHEKIYKMDIMAYVAQHEERSQNDSILNSSVHNKSIEELGISRQPSSAAKIPSSAKIITIVDNAPLNLSMKSIPEENQKAGSTGSTKASDNGSFGIKSGGTTNIENLLKDYTMPTDILFKSNSIGNQPCSLESTPSNRYVSVPSNNSSHFGFSTKAAPTHFSSSTAMQSNRGHVAKQNSIQFDHSFQMSQTSRIAEQKPVYDQYSYQSKANYNTAPKLAESRQRAQTTVYEIDDELEPKRMSRISMKNVPIGSMRPSTITEPRDENFFEKILKGIGCVVRDPVKGHK